MTTETTKHTHTPGPWVQSENPEQVSWIVGGDRGNTFVAEVMGDIGENAEVDANARLIAAAPDGLEAARFMLEVLPVISPEAVGSYALANDIAEARARLEAFIAKATA